VIRTPSLRLAALTLALASALAARAARAQPYDPAYRWRTAETAHFRLHFHQGEEALAAEVAAVAERAHAVLSPRLGWDPGRTEIVLSDDTDDANGLATPLPYNTIRLYAAPPQELSELNAYRDWVASLVFHEYVHILHLDHVGGFPAVLNKVFGKIYPPNGLTPGWMIEGLAVLHEADGEPGPKSGRNRSAIHAMYMRSLALEPPGFPRLDQASNPSLEWPVGDRPYLLGGKFWEYIQEKNGDEAIAGYVARQGAQVWPYAPSHVGEPFFGQSFPDLWTAFAARAETQARQELDRIEARPVTTSIRLTFEGGRAGWPRWSPDGRSIFYLRASLDAEPALLRVTPGGKASARLGSAIGGDGLAVGGGKVILSRPEVWHGYRVYDDLWSVDPRSGARHRLTRGARASEPALSGDGAWLAYVRRTGPGEVALFRRRLAGGPEERVFGAPGTQVYAPALSADGRRLAFAVQRGGRRDLVLLDGDRAVAVTDDEDVDASPTFTPDGRWLLFSSDRGGVYNLYAWPVDACLGGAGVGGCALRQVTNVTTGAFQPAVSPDGATIAFVTYSRAGYDVATLPFRPETWLDPTPALAPASTTGEVASAPAPAPLASRPYSSLPTVLPTWWFPLLTADLKGTAVGAMSSGGDVLGRHTYALATWFGLRSRQLGYSAAYLGGWSWPRVDAASSRYVASARAGSRQMQAVWTPLDVGLDFTFTRLEWQGLIRLGWDASYRDVIGVDDQARAKEPEQLGRRDGFGSELTLRLAWSDAMRFVHSISPEQGRTVTLAGALAARELGSDYDLALGRGAVAQYLRVPFTRHAVLALRVAGGAANGSVGTTAPFKLGGLVQPDVLSLVLNSPAPGADELRGYPGGWLEGTGFVLANAEVRFPIATPEWGHSTWPVFLRRIHGAVYGDLGDAFDLPGKLPFAGHEFRWDELRLGAGAEVRLELALGYFAVTDLRLGLAHAFGRVFRGEGREDHVSLFTGYAVLGGGF
jgi:hypothetical protein